MKRILPSFIVAILWVFFIHCSWAQNSQREYLGFKQNIGEVQVIVSDGTIKIKPYTKKVFHISFIPNQKTVKDFSYAVDMKPEKADFIIKDEPNELRIESPALKAIITKKPFGISYFLHSKPLLNEKEGYSLNDSTQKMSLSVTTDEVLYGGGARVLGMNRRGNKLELYNKAHYGYETHSSLMNYTLPMYLSSDQYAILFDNASVGSLDLDSQKSNTIEYETVSGTVNYFVITGNSWYDLLEQYTLLTGRQPLPARWTLGNYSSRFGYHSQKEVIHTINKFMEDSIPVEAAIIDIYWFGKEIMGTMGKLDWYKDSFPEPEKMIKELSAKGIRTILVTEPFVLTTSDRWNEAVQYGVLGTQPDGKPYTYDFYFGNTGLIDIFKPGARIWFWDIYKGLTKQGVAGWWGDLGEPEVHPAGLHHVNGTANEVHNAYGHEWAKVIYEGYRKDFPTVRPFILMRSGFAGSQRYGMIPWTGDVSRSWGGLVSQPELALQMGMQGLAYTHSDLGGFAGATVMDDELYTRWLQYGVFQPIYRPHAQEHIPSEPVFWKPATKALAKKAIELRYQLLPYIYNMAFENSLTGKPLMIPLFFNEPENKQLLTYEEAYMFGDAFLVAPIKMAGQKEQKVYLPKGSQWIDFYTQQVFQGGQEIAVAVKPEYIPVFVKGGSFIPMQPKISQTKSYSLESFELHFYADATTSKSNYKLFNDDGETYDCIGKGKSEFITAESVHKEGEITIKLNKEPGRNYTDIKDNTITMVIHNLSKKPKKVLVNDEKVKSSELVYNGLSKTVTFSTVLRKAPKTINISY
ncbi:MAG TPA: glycosyl hydrolase [Marinilabiliales bacterium]|nr:MAG: glycosyl hydrolase [Bacteroidetes bacterium GWC2_40_13]OFX71359.1 MAG: glycosyl hydrolase [Bacteroidetes bacterium GWD2_40_43]OFX91446.1 MAG: glycosyl hydrolase [Bacteroidetes bacterium GWE2_40_63]OFY19515.1 MAG: glycosyl hydrolase [Bacteroidetes bacterium GWF2_40_13]OFZ32220.1 MAG: glycosyl hydrolase [Bacteroidetes bacterium RIFOXYC2_FULL_40_12]HAM97683.1 glycosyl hydrolase [Marinilabiliales bacterium]